MTQLHSIASLDYGDGRTCVCRICECGKHRCPGLRVPFVGDTTYRDEYVRKNIEKEPHRRNRHAVFPTKSEPGHFKTTKQEAAEQLLGKDLRPAESYKPRQGLAPPLPFDATSTHRADFPGYLPDFQRARRKQEPLPKLKGVYSTTKGAMDEPVDELNKAGALPKPPKSFRNDDAARQELPFDGIASYTADYPAKDVPVSRFVPRSQLVVVPENREFETTHGEAFRLHPHNVHHQCPAAFVPARPASTDGHIKLSVYNVPSGDTVY